MFCGPFYNLAPFLTDHTVVDNTSACQTGFIECFDDVLWTQCKFSISELDSTRQAFILSQSGSLTLEDCAVEQAPDERVKWLFSVLLAKNTSFTLTRFTTNSIILDSKPFIELLGSRESALLQASIENSSFSDVTRLYGNGSVFETTIGNSEELSIIGVELSHCVNEKGNGAGLYVELHGSGQFIFGGRGIADRISGVFGCEARQSAGFGGLGGELFLYCGDMVVAQAFVISNLRFGQNAASVFGDDVFVDAKNLPQLVKLETSFLFTPNLTNRALLMGFEDRDTTFGIPLALYFEAFPNEAEVGGENNRDFSGCGFPGYPCATLDYAFRLRFDNALDCSLNATGSTSIGHPMTLNDYSAHFFGFSEGTPLTILDPHVSIQQMGYFSCESSFFLSRFAVTFPSSITDRGKLVTLIRSTVQLSLESCLFSPSLPASNPIVYSLVCIVSGHFEMKTVSLTPSTLTSFSFLDDSDLSVIDLQYYDTIKLTGAEFGNISLAKGSVITMAEKPPFSASPDAPDETYDLTLIRCTFQRITGSGPFPSSISFPRKGMISVKMDNVSMSRCTSSSSTEGGGLRFALAESHHLTISNSLIDFCEASTNTTIAEERGRGGWLFIQCLTSLNHDPDFLFKGITFTSNNASVGRDLFVVVGDIATQVSESCFSLNFLSYVFNRENAFFGSDSTGRKDVDLLEFIDTYQAEFIFVSSVHGKSDSTKRCGEKAKPCNSISRGLEHIVSGIEKRLYIDTYVSVNDSCLLSDITTKSLFEEKAHVLLNKSITGDSSRAIFECLGISAFSALEFSFPQSIHSSYSSCITLSSGVLRIIRCSFSPLQSTHFSSPPHSASIALVSFAFIIAESGLVHFDECNFERLNFTTSALFFQGDASLIFKSTLSVSLTLSHSPFIDLPFKHTSYSPVSATFISSQFTSVFRISMGVTVLESFSEHRTLSFNQVNISRCHSLLEKGGLISICASPNLAMTFCSYFGELLPDNAATSMCIWNGSVIDLADCTGVFDLVQISNSSKGGLSVSGSDLTVERGVFQGNNPQFENYPSIRRNMICLSSTSSSGKVTFSSLNAGDGSLPNSSLWIQPSQCKLDGIVTERESTYFIPELLNTSQELRDSRYTFLFTGQLLIPCGLEFGLLVFESNGEELLTTSFNFTSHTNESIALGSVSTECIDAIPEEKTVFVVLLFDLSTTGEGKRTAKTTIREGRTVLPGHNPMTQAGQSRPTTWITIVCILAAINVGVTILLILLLVRSRKEKEKLEHKPLFFKDVEMRELAQEQSRPAQQAVRTSSSHSSFDKECSSSDALLKVDQDTRNVCLRQQKSACELVTNTVENEQAVSSVTKEMITQKAEPSPTTSSIDHLVEGMCCQSPYEKVIVDTRDSLFEHLHHPQTEKERNRDMRGREIYACRILFWVLNGMQHLLGTIGDASLIRELSPYCIMFGEEGTICLGRIHIATKKQSLSKQPSDRIEQKASSDGKEIILNSHENTRWRSPELIENELAFGDEKSISFSIGMLLYEILTQQVPFSDIDSITAGLRILNGRRPPLKEIPNKDLADLISSCLQQSPSDRPDMLTLKCALLSHLPEGSHQITKSDRGNFRPKEAVEQEQNDETLLRQPTDNDQCKHTFYKPPENKGLEQPAISPATPSDDQAVLRAHKRTPSSHTHQHRLYTHHTHHTPSDAQQSPDSGNPKSISSHEKTQQPAFPLLVKPSSSSPSSPAETSSTSHNAPALYALA